MNTYNTAGAVPVKKGGNVLGYLLWVHAQTWLPLDPSGVLLGPPSYKQDATMTVERAASSMLCIADDESGDS